MNQEIKFTAYDPIIHQLRTDKGWRVTLDISQSEYNIIKELPNYQDKQLEVTIKVLGGKEEL